jgi:hypothetical protein
MIVNYNDAGWEIIMQRAHGLLAAQICARWKTSNQPTRWMDTLIATAEHDDVYNEFEDDELLNENGGPVNFKMSGFRQDYCERQLQRALSKSRYITLLMARHIHFVYGQNPAAKKFIKELAKQENLWLKETKASKKEIDASYELLEFCDAFSLLICQNLVQPEGRRIEISNGPDGRKYMLSAVDDGCLTVEDWPFETDEFSVWYESRTLAQLSFKNPEEFKKALALAKVNHLELTIKRSYGK